MPIELLKAIPYTSKCDIWAIGFIFYEMLHGRPPWTAKSEYELINNIETKPLRIDDNLSHNTKDFLQKALGITEEKRISWDELFAHPIFNNVFQEELSNHNEKLENKYKKVMVDIRFHVNSQNIHLKKLWNSLGYDEEKELNGE
jgi:serine/threonine protein kinase